MAQQSGVVAFGDDYKTFLNRMVSDEWNEDMMEEVTGAPTKDHWKVCLVNFFFLKVEGQQQQQQHGSGDVRRESLLPEEAPAPCSTSIIPAKVAGQRLLIYRSRAGGFTIWHNNHEI